MRLRHLLLPVTASLGFAACRERLTSPADCPNLCPGAYEIRDTVLDPVALGDSAFEGYTLAGQGVSLRVSDNFPPSEDRAVIRFIRRPDSILVDTAQRAYAIDSVAIQVTLQFRDTTTHGLRLFLYRLPASVDSTVTFTAVDGAFTPGNLIDSLVVDDSVRSKTLRAVFSGSTLARVDIPPADTGVFAMAVGLKADAGTGAFIGSAGSGTSAPTFATYITIIAPDTITRKQTITRIASFNTFVSQSVPPLDPDLLTAGGAPSARSLIRFPWPSYLRDSVRIVRATLELTPTAPVEGLFGDTTGLVVRAIKVDLGAKSPPCDVTTLALCGGALITTPSRVGVVAGLDTTIGIEVLPVVRAWQGTTNAVPPALILGIDPVFETASFTRATFGSTRTPGYAPRLRLTYAVSFPFGRP